jgi:hypothetical protein
MPGVAQRRTKLGGTWYDRGAPVPDELVNARTVALALVTPSAPQASKGEAALRAELESTKAELAAALALLDEAGMDTPAVPSFDPDEHTVAEVTAHADAHPEDVARVRATEAAGQARKTLLAALDERLAAAGDQAEESPTTEDE